MVDPSFGDTPAESLHHSTATVGSGVSMQGRVKVKTFIQAALGSPGRNSVAPSMCCWYKDFSSMRANTIAMCSVEELRSSSSASLFASMLKHIPHRSTNISLPCQHGKGFVHQMLLVWERERGFGRGRGDAFPAELLVQQHFGLRPAPLGCPMLQTSSWRVMPVQTIIPQCLFLHRKKEQLSWTPRGCGAEHVGRWDGECWALQVSPGGRRCFEL